MKLENRLAPAKIVKTYVGVGGVSVSAEEKVTNRSFHEDSIIKQAHVQKLKDECRAMLPTTIDTLDIVSTGYIIDGRAERIATGVTGTTIEAHYKAITAKPVLKRNIDRCIIERLKLPIAGYITSALATADVVLSKDERMLGCMLVDFGAETTTVSIYKNDALVLLETLPMGGRNITRDIMSLNLVSSEAEHLKIASGKAKGFKSENNVRLKFEGDNMVEIDLAKLTSVVEARSEEIIANVE
ncbi:MAG: cell division protein FtsA, partial [Bacteroidaceae bacterium]|nr:cell division protein FtsA [Bacteroidaceae bacterium]